MKLKRWLPMMGGKPISSLLTGLISYWKMDETSNGSGAVTRVDSVVASGNDLTDVNTTTSVAGLISNAAVFVNADSNELTHVSNASLQTGNIDFTVAGWLRVDAWGNRIVIWKGNEYIAYLGAGHTLSFEIASQGVSVYCDADEFSLNNWVFYVGWHDSVGDTINVQINNGAAHSQATAAVAPTAGAIALRLGLTLGGNLDEWGFWKRTLTTAEKTALYNAGAGKTYPF